MRQLDVLIETVERFTHPVGFSTHPRVYVPDERDQSPEAEAKRNLLRGGLFIVSTAKSGEPSRLSESRLRNFMVLSESWIEALSDDPEGSDFSRYANACANLAAFLCKRVDQPLLRAPA